MTTFDTGCEPCVPCTGCAATTCLENGGRTCECWNALCESCECPDGCGT